MSDTTPAELVVDIDAISSDDFLEFLEMSQRWTEQGAGASLPASELRRALDILRPAVTNLDIGKLPFRQLLNGEIFRRVLDGITEAASPNSDGG